MKRIFTFSILYGVVSVSLLFAAPVTNPLQQKSGPSASSNNWAKNKLDLHQIHNVSFWGGIGYSGLLHPQYSGNFSTQPNISSVQSKFMGGAGGILGIGYEWHYKKFMLLVGPEFRIFSSKDKLQFNLQNNLSPYEGPLSVVGSNPASQYVLPGQTKYYDPIGFSENQAIGQIMLPVMAGAQWTDLNVPVYFLAGFKLGYTLFDNYTQTANLHSWIHDNQAYDPAWENIRDLSTVDYKVKGSNKLGLDVALSAEVGLYLNHYLSPEWNEMNEAKAHPWHMRVALFLDYGLPVMSMEHLPVSMLTVGEQTISTTTMHTSELVSDNAKLNSLLVGAKFTAVLQLSKPKQEKPQSPYLVLQILNGRTGEPIVGNDAKNAEILITNLANNRVSKRIANSKGMVVQRTAAGDYKVDVVKPGFLPFEPIQRQLIQGENMNLKQKLDTNYLYLYPEPVFSCVITNKTTGEPIGANITVIDTALNEEVEKLRADGVRGHAETKLPLHRAYSVMVEASNFKTEIFTIGMQELDDIHREFALEPIVKGRTYVIRNLFFASDETQILPQSEPSLQELFDFLNDNPEVRIRIVGHTDWVGSDKDNQILSEGRATSVKQSMVERGIDPSRMETEGKGESQPVDTNETEEGRQNNRRVEFTIL